MKIKKVDDKPMVIHTKEKAKIHDWEWQDDTTLNVKIRENVTFQNGEVCDAEGSVIYFGQMMKKQKPSLIWGSMSY